MVIFSTQLLVHHLPHILPTKSQLVEGFIFISFRRNGGGGVGEGEDFLGWSEEYSLNDEQCI